MFTKDMMTALETDGEKLRQLTGEDHGPVFLIDGDDEIAAAERERCAKIAENPGFIEARDTEWDEGVNYAKRFIAAAIRGRGQPEKHYDHKYEPGAYGVCRRCGGERHQ